MKAGLIGAEGAKRRLLRVVAAAAVAFPTVLPAQQSATTEPTIQLPDQASGQPPAQLPGGAPMTGANAGPAGHVGTMTAPNALPRTTPAAPSSAPVAAMPAASGIDHSGATSVAVAAPAPTEPAASTGWVIDLRPPAQTPSGTVTMGASLPQPGILRLTGESAQGDVVMALPQSGPVPAQFNLILRSSVNDLPERSSIAVTVNGKPAGSWPLDKIGDWGTISVPGKALHGGDNVIGLNLLQHHRIFCGPDASFGVWTEFDLTRSGAVVPLDSVTPDASAFRVAVQNIAERGQALDLRMQDGADAQTMATVLEAIRKVVPAAPEVRVLSPYDPLDSSGRRVGVVIMPPGTAPGAAPTVRFLRNAQEAVVMVVSPGNGLDKLLADQLGPQVPPVTLPQMHAGQWTSFNDLGLPLIVRNTRYAEANVDFTLPSNWMILSSQRAAMRLDYGFAEHLPKGSLLVVKVNGNTIRLLPLDRDGGAVRPELHLRFPANYLVGGPNRITFEMIVPGDPPTLECPAQDTDMLAVLGSTSIFVPPSPPMDFGTMGDALRAIGPLDVASATKNDPRLWAFQAQLDPAVAFTGGKPHLRIATVPRDISAIDDALILRRAPLVNLLQGEGNASLQPRVTSAAPAPAPAFNLRSAADASAPPVDSAEGAATPETSATVMSNLLDGSLLRQVRNRILPDGEQLSDWLRGRNARAVLVAPQEGGAGTWWLVMRSDVTAEDVARAFEGFRQSRQAEGTRVALWQGGESWESWPPHPQPRLAGPVTVKNVFGVVGNYASWAPLYFVILVIALTVLSAIPAGIYVRMTRRKGDRE